jgi:hypothetical protein
MDEKELKEKEQQEKTDKKPKKEKVEEKKEEITEVKPVDYSTKPRWMRYALLKAEVRGIGLEKEEAGYKSQYFYVALQEMQNVFTKLELKYLLYSLYSEETRVYADTVRSYTIRKLYCALTGEFVASTEIDITNLKTITDPFELKNEILRIAEPRDAWKTLYLDYMEPQNLGAISTYFQRYTYNQLYDFQETKEDKIEKKGKLEGKLVVEETKKETKETKEVVTPKENRINDEAAELRSKIKKEFIRDDIVKELNGRKLASMTLEEAKEFYKELEKNYNKKETEGEN